jgi:methylated-DNA-[protein]-cysteine S-methyltransferase
MHFSHVKIQTDFGTVAIVYTCDPFQLYKLYLPRRSVQILTQDIQKEFSVDQKYHPNIDKLVTQLQHYFKGNPIDTPWQWFSWQNLTPLQVKTLEQTAKIPYGAVCSYGTLAQKIGRPKAARFVGSCMAQNPFPIFIPCHRVIRSDGTIGCFGGGL